MATVSLPVWETDSVRQAQPRLVLHDYTSAARPRIRRRARRQNLWENLLFAAAVVAVLLFCLIGLVQGISRSVTMTDAALPGVVLPVTVHPGDTLWTYAQKYGAPDAYILDRVEMIARANHLADDASLVPGQHLQIPVTNPVLIAQLQSRHRIALLRH